MFNTGKTRKNFEQCPNRTTDGGTSNNTKFVLRCAAYPSGLETPVSLSGMSYSENRKNVAMMAGCLACPYSKTPLERTQGLGVSSQGDPVEVTIFLRPEDTAGSPVNHLD